MAHVLGPDLEGGSVNANWEPTLLGHLSIPLISKDALTEQEIELIRNYEWVVELDPSGVIPDIMGHRELSFIVSKKVRDWLVEHQPWRPSFYEIKMTTIGPAQGRQSHLGYYVMGHVPELDPMDAEQTSWAGGMYGHPDGKTLDTSSRARCVVHSSLISGQHIWRTSHKQGREYMCSNDFWRFFQESYLAGWSSWKVCSEI